MSLSGVSTMFLSGMGITSLAGGVNASSLEGPLRLLFLGFFFFLPHPLTFFVPLLSPLILAGSSFDPGISRADRVSEPNDASHLTEDDPGRAEKSTHGFGDDGDGGSGVGMGVWVGAETGAVVGVGVRIGD